jgi:hypothetical protein
VEPPDPDVPIGARTAAGGELVRYRLAGWIRVLAPCAPGVFLPFWLWSWIQRGDFSDLPLALLLLAVLVGLSVLAVNRPSVTLTRDGLVVRSFLTSATFEWWDISRVDTVRRVAAITTPAGTFTLPIPTFLPLCTVTDENDVPLRRDALVLPIAVQSWWATYRGPHWFPRPLDPWTPTRDARGRVVLRASFADRYVHLLAFAGTFVGQLGFAPAPLWDELTSMAIVVAVIGAIMVAHHAWVRVRIEGDHVVVRTLKNGTTRVPRASIYAVLEVPDGWPFTRRGITCLALSTPAGFIRLPAPLNRHATFGSSSAFYRQWAWLHQHVVAPATEAPARGDVGSLEQGDGQPQR